MIAEKDDITGDVERPCLLSKQHKEDHLDQLLQNLQLC